MTQKQYLIYVLILPLLLFTSCTTSKQLKMHKQSLRSIVSSPMSAEDKFDAFAQITADVLDEATSLNSPVKTYRYLNKFSKHNDRELGILLKELEPWQANMSFKQKANFAKKAVTKPYGRKLVRLVPKVTKMMAKGEYKIGKMEQVLLLFKLRKVLK
ncbi:MAG: hypothetical protein AAFR87_12705 [Bacteroidota bacterium]